MEDPRITKYSTKNLQVLIRKNLKTNPILLLSIHFFLFSDTCKFHEFSYFLIIQDVNFYSFWKSSIHCVNKYCKHYFRCTRMHIPPSHAYKFISQPFEDNLHTVFFNGLGAFYWLSFRILLLKSEVKNQVPGKRVYFLRRGYYLI